MNTPPVKPTVEPLRVLSLGAGVQSSTLALMMARGDMPPPHCAIFADTKAEPRAVYEWLDWLEKQLQFPVYRVVQGEGLTASVLNWRRAKKSGFFYNETAIPMRAMNLENRQSPLRRQCTADFKIVPIQRKVRQLLAKGQTCIMQLGISLDEVRRMKPSRVRYIVHEWPLIDARISRRGCLAWMKDHGFPEPPRSACTYCPFHSNDEWKRLRDHEPEDFLSAVEFEREFHRRFDLVPANVRALKSKPYLHQQCVPLDQVVFDDDGGQGQFTMECEGLCGT